MRPPFPGTVDPAAPTSGAGPSAFVPLPDRVDRYRIVRLLGEGGMGAVYLAEQDEPVRREVALKVLRPGANSAEVLARFASERQALAMMEHPNITRVYDAGLTPAGVPYFVMELVSGQPIDEYAASQRLTTRARTALMVQVCRAVQHAHQKGIIHRDLKPSNILVTEVDGRPVCKVIDFGIAMAISPEAGDARVTATGITVGTPAYMSPEQFLSGGQDIDTRTDIYSLGVVLYELLAGVLPGGNETGPSWRSLVRRAEGDVPRVSAQFAALSETARALYAAERGTDAAGLQRVLHGDLDSILLKTLDADRERRYATAAALALDLEHYLADKPVTARPPSATYRFRKFARRHRAGVVLSGLLLLVLVATAVGATIQARRLAVATAVAQSRQRQAERLIGYMLNDFSEKLRPIGRLDVMDDVATRALAYFAEIPLETLSDDEIFQRSDALRQLGELRIEQGRFAQAGRLMAQAVALIRPLAGRQPGNPAYQLGLAHAEYGAGSVAWRTGETAEALRHFVPFVEISERLVGAYPDSLEYRAQRAYALNNIGFATEATGDLTGALRSYGIARTVLGDLVARDSSNVVWQRAFAALLNATAVADQKAGDLDGALRYHRLELAARVRVLHRDSADAELRRELAVGHLYLGDTHLWLGQVAEAAAQTDTARRMYLALVARDPANASWQLSLANAWRRSAQVAREAGRLPEARAALEHARDALQRLLARGANARADRELAMVDVQSADLLARTGSVAAAVALARRTVSVADSALTTRPLDIERTRQAAAASLVLGESLARARDAAAARAAWAHALELARLPAAAAQTEFVALQARALLTLGRDAEAQAALRELGRRHVGLPSLAPAMRLAARPVP